MATTSATEETSDPRHTPWPGPTFVAGMPTFQITALTAMARLPKFDIRNGDPSDARSLLIKPTIPQSYHWVPVAGIEPADALSVVDAFIRGHLSHLNAHRPPNMSDAQARKAAIILGVARATSTALYSVSSGDLIPGEVAAPRVIVTRTPEGGYNMSANPDLPAAEKTALGVALELTPLEEMVAAQLLSCSVGIIPLQGYSLMMTNHHYLSDANSQSRKAYAVVEKQFWKGTEYSQWFNDDIALIQDVLWHKACHPVSLTLKEMTCADSRVAAMVKSAGAGAAAARLPALEPEVRAANSHMTMMATVAPLFEICGGTLDYNLYQIGIDTVKSFPIGGRATARPTGLPDVVPSTVTNRTEAKEWLKSMVDRNSDKVSFCFGFYCALSDQNQTLGGAAGTDTLKTSFSLAKLRQQSYAAFVSGQQTYNDYAAARNAMRAAGRFVAPSFKVE